MKIRNSRMVVIILLILMGQLSIAMEDRAPPEAFSLSNIYHGFVSKNLRTEDWRNIVQEKIDGKVLEGRIIEKTLQFLFQKEILEGGDALKRVLFHETTADNKPLTVGFVLDFFKEKYVRIKQFDKWYKLKEEDKKLFNTQNNNLKMGEYAELVRQGDPQAEHTYPCTRGCNYLLILLSLQSELTKPDMQEAKKDFQLSIMPELEQLGNVHNLFNRGVDYSLDMVDKIILAILERKRDKWWARRDNPVNIYKLASD